MTSIYPTGKWHNRPNDRPKATGHFVFWDSKWHKSYNYILQHFNKECDTYLDLDDVETMQDHDKLEVIMIPEPTPAKEKSESGSKILLDNTELVVLS